MATYAVGDIQGCFDGFMALLAHAGFDATEDELWVVGDAVNRGPQSLETLRWLKNHQERVTMVLGNHDLHLLAVSRGIRAPKEGDTFHDVLAAPDRDDLLDWLRSRPFIHRARGHLLVHGGLLPAWTEAEAEVHAGVASHLLEGTSCEELLRAIYEGNPGPWDPGLQGIPRHAFVARALTRLRYIDRRGAMVGGHDAPVRGSSPDAIPWFAFPGPPRQDVIVFGHWSTLGLSMTDRFIALDSGGVHGGRFTAVRLEDRATFQVPGLGR